MERILLFLDDRKADRQFQEALAGDYQVTTGTRRTLSEAWDLAIVAAARLEKLRELLQARKCAAEPALLPVVLAVPATDLAGFTPEPWVDEVISLPAAGAELAVRVRNLLRARRLSRELETGRQELEAEQARLSAIMQSAHEGIVVADAQGRVVMVNPHAEFLYGPPASPDEDLQNQAPPKLSHADGSPYDPRDLPLARAALHGETHSRVEMVAAWPGGRRRDLLANAAPIRDKQGRVTGAVEVFQDVSAQKEAQRERDRLHRRLQEAAEEVQRVNEALQAQAAELETQAVELEASNEELRIQNEELEKLTTQVHVERAYLRSVLDQLPAGVVIADAFSRRLTLGNRQGREIWGRTARPETTLDEFFATPRFHPDGRPYRVREMPLERSLRLGERVQQEEMEVERPGGSRRTLSISAAPLLDRQGRISAALNICLDITARKEAEAARRRAQEEWERTFDAVPDLIAILDKEHRVVRANRAMAAALGQTPEQMAGRRCYEVMHRLEGPPAFCPHSRMLQEGREQVAELREMGRYFLVSATPLTDEQGRVTGSVHVARDITERRQAEEALQREKNIADTTLESLPGIFYLFDTQGRFLKWNKNFEVVSGYSPEEIAGMHPVDFFAGEEKQLISERIQEVFAKGETAVEAEFISKDGHQTPYFFTGLKTTIDGKDCLIGMGIDITARRQAEEALRQGEERLRMAQQVAQIGTFDLDLQTGINTWTPELESMYGLRPGSFGRTQQAWEEVVHPEDRPRIIRQVELDFETGEPGEGEWRVVWPDGSVRWLAGRWQFIKDNAGKPQRLIGVNIDITGRRRAEEAIRRQAELLDLAHDAIFVRDLQDRIVFWNRGAEETYGYSRAEALGKDLHLLLKTGFPKNLKEMEEELVATGRWEGELVHYTKGGRRLVMAASWSLHRDEPGNPARILEICSDITARKAAEAELQKAYDEMERRVEERTADLKATVEQLQWEIEERLAAEQQAASIGRFYRLLSRVNEAMVRAPDRETMLQQACLIAVEEGLFRMAWVGLVDSSGRELKVATQYGFDERYLETLTIPLADVPQGRGPTGIAVREGRFDVCNDIASDPRMAPWREQALARGYRSSGAFPLRLGERVVGALTLYAAEPGFFSRDEMELLQSLSDNLSFAMESMDRNDKRRQAEEALRLSEERFVQFMRHLPGAALMRDTRGRYLFVNERWERVFGKIQPKWQGKTLEEVWPAEFAARYRALDQEVMQGRQAIQSIETFPTAQGERVFLATRFPILDQSGQPTMVGAVGIDITERRRAEEAVLEQTRLLDAFFEHALTPQVFLDRDFNFIRVNRAYATACQREVQEFAGRNHFELYPHEENQAIFAEVVRTKEPYEAVAKPFEFPDHPEWGVTYWNWNLTPILDGQGEVDFLVFSLKDVTERVRGGQALDQERQRLFAVMEALPAYVALLTPQGGLPYVNQEFIRRFGDPQGRRCYELLFDEDKPCEGCKALGVFQTKTAVGWEWTGPDQTTYQVYDYPFTDRDGSPLVLELGVDISYRKQAEEQLRSLSAYARSLIEASLDPLVTISPQGKITDVNRATEEATGISRERLIGTDFSDYFTQPEKAREGYQEVLARGLVRDYPLALRHASGRIMDVLYNATTYKNEAGWVQGVLAAARDVTERKKAEKALRESEQKLRFLAAQILKVQERERGHLSRELHDGLGQALLVFKLQLRGIERRLPEDWTQLRQDCSYALQHVDGIIEEMRRLSHNLSPTVLEDLGLTAAIRNLCEEFQRVHDLEFVLDLDEVGGTLSGDLKINVYRICQEALANISKYAKASLVQLAVKQEGDKIACVIEDNGAGFDVEKVLSREPGPKGMGLAAMSERVRTLGGALEVFSRPGTGTKISFTIPGPKAEHPAPQG